MFDVSHMGEVTVTGAGAFEFVQSVTSNDVSRLTPGQGAVFVAPERAGGIIDDIIVYCRAENDYLIVLNAGCKDKDWDWLQAQAEGKADVAADGHQRRDGADRRAGAAGRCHLSATLAGGGLDGLNAFTSRMQLCRAARRLFSRTGYTGEDGFEIFCDWEDAPTLWEMLTERGATPAGLGARDVLRLEAAYPLYGHELDAETSPFESGVGWAVKRSKGDFVGQ